MPKTPITQLLGGPVYPADSLLNTCPDGIVRILISYWYWKDVDLRRLFAHYFPGYRVQLMADSGAFSAYSAGSSVDVHAYADWVHEYHDLFTCYSNLDVKGDVDAGLKNQQILEARGLRPVPVYHAGEPWSVLTDMIADYRYIALGGVAGGSGTNTSVDVTRWLTQVLRAGQGRSVFHGFGTTNFSRLKLLPFYSVDSTTWTQGLRFGNFAIYAPRHLRPYTMRCGDLAWWQHWASLVRAYGFDPAIFAAPRNTAQRQPVGVLAARSFFILNQTLQQLHGPIAMPAPARSRTGLEVYQAPPGLHLYLAAGPGADLMTMLALAVNPHWQSQQSQTAGSTSPLFRRRADARTRAQRTQRTQRTQRSK